MQKSELYMADQAIGLLLNNAESLVDDALRLARHPLPEYAGTDSHDLAIDLGDAITEYERLRNEAERQASKMRIAYRSLAERAKP